MSYILDALKKSDQQRQRGATPTLPAAQVVVAQPRQPMYAYYGLLAAVLLCAGVAIGWLRPWQVEQPMKNTAKSPDSAPHQTTPTLLPAPQEIAQKGIRELSTPNPVAAALPAAKPDATKPGIPAPVMAEPHIPEKSLDHAIVAPDQKAISMTELPAAIQQGIPAMSVQLHAYSSKPADRLVSINSHMLGEGGLLAPGLKLEQITPDGMIFSYKGYLFQRGVR